MDRDAINKICELNSASTTIDWDAVTAGVELAVEIPEGNKLVDLETYMSGRRRFRGAFNTASVWSFVNYVGQFADAQNCFINVDKMAATVFLDEGNKDDPGHCDHVAQLTLPPTALWAAVMAIHGRPMSQREMAEWLMDWRSYLVGDVDQAIKAVRAIDINASMSSSTTVGNMSEHQTTMESVAAVSKHVLPETFTVAGKLYEDLSVRTVHLDLSVIASDKPQLKLRIRSFEWLKEELGNEFAAALEGRLPDGIIPLIGAFDPNPNRNTF